MLRKKLSISLLCFMLLCAEATPLHTGAPQSGLLRHESNLAAFETDAVSFDMERSVRMRATPTRAAMSIQKAASARLLATIRSLIMETVEAGFTKEDISRLSRISLATVQSFEKETPVATELECRSLQRACEALDQLDFHFSNLLTGSRLNHEMIVSAAAELGFSLSQEKLEEMIEGRQKPDLITTMAVIQSLKQIIPQTLSKLFGGNNPSADPVSDIFPITSRAMILIYNWKPEMAIQEVSDEIHLGVSELQQILITYPFDANGKAAIRKLHHFLTDAAYFLDIYRYCTWLENKFDFTKLMQIDVTAEVGASPSASRETVSEMVARLADLYPSDFPILPEDLEIDFDLAKRIMAILEACSGWKRDEGHALRFYDFIAPGESRKGVRWAKDVEKGYPLLEYKTRGQSERSFARKHPLATFTFVEQNTLCLNFDGVDYYFHQNGQVDEPLRDEIPNRLPAAVDIAYFSIDIKVPQSGPIKILELNSGVQSGYSGYMHAYKEQMAALFWRYWAGLGLPCWFVLETGVLPENYRTLDPAAIDALKKKLSYSAIPELKSNNGRFFQSLIEFKLALKQLKVGTRKPNFNPADIQTYSGIIFYYSLFKGDAPLALMKQYPWILFVNTADHITEFFDNKYLLDVLLEESQLTNYQPKSMLIPKKSALNSVAQILESMKGCDFIIKPLNAAQGDGIYAASNEALAAALNQAFGKFNTAEEFYIESGRRPSLKDPQEYWLYDSSGHFLVQERISSEPIEMDGELMDGTLRVAAVVWGRPGDVHVELLGSYWKLPPQPITSQAPLGEQVISRIDQGGKIGAARFDDPKQVKRVETTLHEILPTLFDAMLSYQNKEQLIMSLLNSENLNRRVMGIEVASEIEDWSAPLLEKLISLAAEADDRQQHALAQFLLGNAKKWGQLMPMVITLLKSENETVVSQLIVQALDQADGNAALRNTVYSLSPDQLSEPAAKIKLASSLFEGNKVTQNEVLNLFQQCFREGDDLVKIEILENIVKLKWLNDGPWLRTNIERGSRIYAALLALYLEHRGGDLSKAGLSAGTLTTELQAYWEALGTRDMIRLIEKMCEFRIFGKADIMRDLIRHMRQKIEATRPGESEVLEIFIAAEQAFANGVAVAPILKRLAQMIANYLQDDIRINAAFLQAA